MSNLKKLVAARATIRPFPASVGQNFAWSFLKTISTMAQEFQCSTNLKVSHKWIYDRKIALPRFSYQQTKWSWKVFTSGHRRLNTDVHFNFSLWRRNLDQWLNTLRSGNSWTLNTTFLTTSCRMISSNLHHKIRDNFGLERSEAWIFSSRPWWDWHETYFLMFTKMWCLFFWQAEGIFLH